jgi:hypothetical protein
MGGLLEELSEPEEAMTRKPKRQAGKSWHQGLNFLLQM